MNILFVTLLIIQIAFSPKKRLIVMISLIRKTGLILFLFFNLLFESYSQNISLRPDWYFGMLGNNIGTAGIIVTDLDGNGINDIISNGMYSTDFWSPSSFITITEYSTKANTFSTKWISRLFNKRITKVQVYDFNNDGVQEIYAGFNDGSIKIFNGRSFIETNTFYTLKRKSSNFDPPNQIDDLQFGDADNDFKTDLVATNGDTTYIFDSSYKLKFKINYGAKHFTIGDIDNDHSNEIVYSNGKIFQNSNGNNMFKFQFYTYNKQSPVALSDMNFDGTKDLIYTSQDTLITYDFKNKRNIWSVKTNSNYDQFITGLWLSDYDDDAIDDIFVGNISKYGVDCYNGRGGLAAFSLSNINGVTNAAIADLDGDHDLDLICSTGANNTGPDYFYMYDLNSKTRLWQSTYYEGGFTAFDAGDLKNDNTNVLVIGNYGNKNTYYEYPLLIALNNEDHSIVWQNENPDFLRVDNISEVKIGDITNDGKNQLLIGVANRYPFTYVYALDSNFSITRNFELWGMDMVMDIKIADIDSDSKNDLIVTLGTNVVASSTPSSYQNYIYIFDAETGVEKWKSKQLGGIGSKIGSLCVSNIDNDDALEIVALKSEYYSTKSNLLIIDGKTYDLTEMNETHYTAVDVADTDGDGTKEIILGTDNGEISILDGSTFIEKQHIKTDCNMISALKVYDLDNDSSQELVFTDNFILNIYNMKNAAAQWKSDTLSYSVGLFNSLKIGDFDSDGNPEILVNLNHALIQYKVGNDSTYTSINPVEIKNTNKLFQNFPNPVSSETTIEFDLEKYFDVQIKIFNSLGTELYSRNYHAMHSGRNRINVNADNLPSGIYTYVLIIDHKKYSKKMVVIK